MNGREPAFEQTYRRRDTPAWARTSVRHRTAPLLAVPAIREPQMPLRWLTTAIGLSGLLVAATMVHQHIGVALAAPGFAALIALLAALSLLWRRCHALSGDHPAPWHRRGRDFAEAAVLLVATGVIGALGSYAAAAFTTGFDDALLERGDRALHFDWLAVYRLVAGHPALQWLAEAAYASIWVTPWVIIGWCAWHARQADARRFIAAFWLGAMLTLLLFPLLPARGALAYLWRGPIPYVPLEGLAQGHIIPLLRAHALPRVDLGALQGLVCAPSFHTVSAAIFIASAWPHPPLRRWLVPLNAAMLLATPVEGTHYLTDMLLGLVVAATALATVRAVERGWAGG